MGIGVGGVGDFGDRSEGSAAGGGPLHDVEGGAGEGVPLQGHARAVRLCCESRRGKMEGVVADHRAMLVVLVDGGPAAGQIVELRPGVDVLTGHVLKGVVHGVHVHDP